MWQPDQQAQGQWQLQQQPDQAQWQQQPDQAQAHQQILAQQQQAQQQQQQIVAQQQAQLIKFCALVYRWVAYVHSVGEGESLALLLMQKDNVTGAPHIGPKHRGAIEAAVTRWPAELPLPLCDALGCSALLFCNVPLGEDAALLKAPSFCTELKRIDRGDRMLVRLTDDALITLHSQLANRSNALALLQPLIDEHDKHLEHLERMERRLDRLNRL